MWDAGRSGQANDSTAFIAEHDIVMPDQASRTLPYSGVMDE